MGFRKRTDSYWARRSAERLTLAEYEMEPYLEQVIKAYEDARREVINDLRRMYAAYYREDKSFNMIALNSIAPKGDIQRFRDEMKRRGLNTKLPDNYGGRITRLELIESQLQAKIDRIGQKTVQIEGKSHRNTVESSFYHSIYDVSKGLGATPAFTQLNEKTINKILETKFEGKNYSERIWGNTNILAQQLREKLAKAIATGQSLEKTTREFRERFGVGESYAKRLIRTETNYFENTAEIESYEAMGIEYFVFVATLDDRTSEICQSMDGKKFKVKDAVAGDNYPPLHPNCRSTIRAYIGKDYEPETRIYRDPETGRNKYTYNMDYEEWRNSLEYEWASSGGEKIEVAVGPRTMRSVDADKIAEYLKNESGIEFREVNRLDTKLTEEQIIERVGGGDRTLGSCASAAFAYVGNKMGYDVLDFRGGNSQKFFSVNAKFIIEKIATIKEGLDGHKTAYALLKTMKPGKEYYFGIGKHAAIVRLDGKLKKWQYLELQSPKDNGWKSFTKDTLKQRFGCPKSQTKFGLKMPVRGYIAEVNAFKQIDAFSDIIGYVNTANNKQLKGKTGRII